MIDENAKAICQKQEQQQWKIIPQSGQSVCQKYKKSHFVNKVLGQKVTNSTAQQQVQKYLSENISQIPNSSKQHLKINLMSVLVKISFQKYNQQQLTKKTSTIFQLIQSLRNQFFIPENIPNSNLICKNVDNHVVDGNSTVQDSLITSQEGTYELFIHVKGESQIQQSQIQQNFNDPSDEKILKMLELIVKKLENNRTQELIRYKLNKKLRPNITEKLSRIGEIIHQVNKENEFMRASLKDLISSSTNQQIQMRMDEVYHNYQDYVNGQKMKDIKNIVDIIKNFRKQLESKQNQIRQLKNTESQKDSQIEDLKDQFKNERQNLTDISLQLADLQSLNDRLQDKINQLTLIANQKTSDIAKIQSDLDSFKVRELSLIEQLKSSKDTLLDKQNQIKTQLINHNIKINQLNRIIQQKQTLLLQKDHEIQKIKQNSVDNKLLSLKKNLANQLPFPCLNAPKIGRIQDILIDPSLSANLKSIIETQMQKPITAIYELLSYDRRNHLKYSLKQKFQNSIHQKRSLLFIALSQEDNKLFGAFTEEKYDMQPESYFIPEFEGCSFLFSVIEKQLKGFMIQKGENSLVFDLDTLIFGDEDLVVDFETSCCTSKFVQGKSIVYNIDMSPGTQKSNYRKFLSDKLVCEKPEKGKSLVNLVHYIIYEIQFEDQVNRLALS